MKNILIRLVYSTHELLDKSVDFESPDRMGRCHR